ncbi:hypothetical protein O3P69_020758 [Scylla paramamosain]|uniref:Uncharacterized protein n=1 Tax=Scylla paramamosain TaxID=85552 RepID=A0AAW0TRM1_SCYPA
MSIKLEDMLTVVKPPPQALDLFRTKIKCKEDFDKAFEKVPEYKIRPEKVRPDDVMGEGPGGWRATHDRGEDLPEPAYADPLPPSMRGLNMDEFYEVDIDWRMLTTARPKNRCEEEIFSSYIRGTVQSFHYPPPRAPLTPHAPTPLTPPLLSPLSPLISRTPALFTDGTPEHLKWSRQVVSQRCQKSPRIHARLKDSYW